LERSSGSGSAGSRWKPPKRRQRGTSTVGKVEPKAAALALRHYSIEFEHESEQLVSFRIRVPLIRHRQFSTNRRVRPARIGS
jgi:hypothetical protein